MLFHLIASAATGAHYAFMAFGVFGGFLAWRWRWVIWLHLAAVGWMVLIVAAHLSCPLTWINDHARARAGLPAQPGGFIATHLAGVFYPRGAAPVAAAAVALVVAVSWAGYARRRIKAGRIKAGRIKADRIKADRIKAGQVKAGKITAAPPRPPTGSRWRSHRSSPGPTARR